MSLNFKEQQLSLTIFNRKLQKMSNTTAQTYTLTSSGERRPFNLVAVDGVRCIHCNRIISHSDYSEHVRMHLPLHYNKPNHGKISQPSRINFSDLLSEQEEKPCPQLAVQSLFPEQMPQSQQIRKNKQLAEPLPVQKFNDPSFPNLLTLNFDEVENEDPADQYSDYMENEIEESIKIEKTVKVEPESVKIRKKYLNYYRNQKQTLPFMDKFNCKQKNIEEFHDAQTSRNSSICVYEVSPLQIIKQQNQPVTIRIKNQKKAKKNFVKEKIGTISTKTSFFNNWRKQSHFETDSERTEIGDNIEQRTNRFECRGCKGFYCPDCGSDIPPQFRPVNTLGVSKSGEIDNFYRNHVDQEKTSRILRECETCRN